jgi:hypothetical protein
MCAGGHRVKVVIHTVDKWSNERYHDEISPLKKCYHQFGDTTIPAMDIELEIFDPSVKLELTSKHRQTVQRNIRGYDIFIYQEDDIDITLAHLEHYIRGTVQLESLAPFHDLNKDNEGLQVIGFLRYEVIGDKSHKAAGLAVNDPDNPTVIHSHSNAPKIDGRIFSSEAPSPPTNKRYLIDMPQQIFAPRCVNGVPYVADELNPHQAFWILSREQILLLNETCAFLTQDQIALKESRGQMVYMSSFSVRVSWMRIIDVSATEY